MKDKYLLKKEKVADLLFDLVKYLLTALGALLLFSEKPINSIIVVITLIISAIVLLFAILLTPLKED